jgi:hypothetical protein
MIRRPIRGSSNTNIHQQSMFKPHVFDPNFDYKMKMLILQWKLELAKQEQQKTQGTNNFHIPTDSDLNLQFNLEQMISPHQNDNIFS